MKTFCYSDSVLEEAEESHYDSGACIINQCINVWGCAEIFPTFRASKTRDMFPQHRIQTCHAIFFYGFVRSNLFAALSSLARVKQSKGEGACLY